jgi:hypothetical protein
MPPDQTYHLAEASLAKQLYQQSFDNERSRLEWHGQLAAARNLIAKAMRDSGNLVHIKDALKTDGRNMAVFRHLLAPPISQDQFLLLNSDWKKASEGVGRTLDDETAASVATTIGLWLDTALISWLSDERVPTEREIDLVFERAASLMAHSKLATTRRGKDSKQQEEAVEELLLSIGWQKVVAAPIKTRAALVEKTFARKVKFATRTSPQEVDIACGLNDDYLLALECKVSNDETNSIKRVNDVLKKAKAWKDHWGSFVIPAALLQGVYKHGDIKRLLDDGVEVFWSHNMSDLEAWLAVRS